MAKKQKIEKMARPSKETLRRRFEERVLAQERKNFGEATETLHRLPTGEYALPHVQERWHGFLLAYDNGPNALPIREASPYAYGLILDMYAVAQNLRESGQNPSLAELVTKWAVAIETNPDAIYEDVYSAVVDLIDPLVRMDHLPGSVVESVTILVEHFTASQHARDITPVASGTKVIPDGKNGQIRKSKKTVPMLQ
jgi:hypothetical protein